MMDHLSSLLQEADDIAQAFDLEPLSVHDGPGVSSASICHGHQDHQREKPHFHKVGKTPLSRKTWKKPADKPKRPLSAYNLFFQHEREKIITNDPETTLETVLFKIRNTKKPKKRKHRKTHGMIGFAELARTIADKWKTIDEAGRAIYEEKANEEKEKYKIELDKWTRTKEEKSREQERPITILNSDTPHHVVYDEPYTPPRHSRFMTSNFQQQQQQQDEEAANVVTPQQINSLINSSNTLMTRFASLSPDADEYDYLKMTQQTIEMAKASLSLPLFRNLNVPSHILPGESLSFAECGYTNPTPLANDLCGNSPGTDPAEDPMNSILYK